MINYLRSAYGPWLSDIVLLLPLLVYGLFLLLSIPLYSWL